MRNITILIPFLLLVVAVSGSQRALAADYKIEKGKGSVYRFFADRHRSLFLVTEEGILVTDLMNREAATWLKRELNNRFNSPVKSVIYSHNHSDHVYGAEVFHDSPTIFISSRLTKQDLMVTGARTVIPHITFEKTMHISLGNHEVA